MHCQIVWNVNKLVFRSASVQGLAASALALLGVLRQTC